MRRAIIAGYDRCSTMSTEANPRGLYPKVGEAYFADPDERGQRWIWAAGDGDVINPLGFQDLPDFPIAAENGPSVVGRVVP
jgi:hypothetical protein